MYLQSHFNTLQQNTENKEKQLKKQERIALLNENIGLRKLNFTSKKKTVEKKKEKTNDQDDD